MQLIKVDALRLKSTPASLIFLLKFSRILELEAISVKSQNCKTLLGGSRNIIGRIMCTMVFHSVLEGYSNWETVLETSVGNTMSVANVKCSRDASLL
ncbi:hypothetical protein CDAR_533901 [Caerostris darwini]|uniref:Uncharacterized protein n=1 Tax=Caerostris darwini TaxID=1538125 RepID=A0AAV4S8D8_9ARAC|nr:hypothetical protein CDAR_533901 [Caerostris darwini]